MSYIIWHINC